jgi:hypothetical protein
MPLLQILLTLIVVGVLLWLVNRFIPMAGSIKSILNAVVVIGVVLWLLNVFGLFHSLSRIRVGWPKRLRDLASGLLRVDWMRRLPGGESAKNRNVTRRQAVWAWLDGFFLERGKQCSELF